MDVEKVRACLEEFLTPMLKASRLDLRYRIRPDGSSGESNTHGVTVDFTGPDTDLLLMRGGELLEALEELTVRVLRVSPEEREAISFDSGDYRALRVEELRMIAETAAEKVQTSGVPFTLNPMNSRERRIVHLSLQDNPAVRTESEGFGPYRKVVILPAEKK